MYRATRAGLIFALLAILFIACSGRQVIQADRVDKVDRIPFPEAEYAALPIIGSGTATVTGQAFLKTRGGDVKTAAGNSVLLNPVTSYSRQWFETEYIGGKPLADYDPRLEQFMVAKIVDAQGNFTFKNVPAGDYYVTTGVFWEAPTTNGLKRQGATLSQQVHVSDGQTVEIILTK